MLKGRVLIIDDNEELLLVLKEIISSHHECIEFSRADLALELIKNQGDFDCIFCDLMMPTMSGIEFYENLKKIDPNFLPQVVFMTGGSFTKVTDDFLKLPGITHCEKPIDIKKLLGLIQNLVQMNRDKNLAQVS